MSYRQKAVSVSLGILAAFSLIFFLLDPPNSGQHLGGIGFGLGMIGITAVEAFILLVVGIYLRVTAKSSPTQASNGESSELLDQPELQAAPVSQKEKGNALLLSAGLVILVGPSICFGGLTAI